MTSWGNAGASGGRSPERFAPHRAANRDGFSDRHFRPSPGLSPFVWVTEVADSLANAKAQDELIEPEKTHLRIMRNNPARPEFAPRSQTIFTRICLPHLLTSLPFVCLPDLCVLSAT